MRKTIKRVLVILIVGSTVMGGVAWAVDWTASTRLSLSTNKTPVHSGGLVTLSGRLKSDRLSCTNSEKVALYKGTKKVETTKTGSDGRYKFVRTPTHTATYHTVYAGKVTGVHPNQHTCLGSTSPNVKVRVI